MQKQKRKIDRKVVLSLDDSENEIQEDRYIDMTSFLILGGWLAGNFVIQLLSSDPNWQIAIERSYFSMMFFGALWLGGALK